MMKMGQQKRHRTILDSKHPRISAIAVQEDQHGVDRPQPLAVGQLGDTQKTLLVTQRRRLRTKQKERKKKAQTIFLDVVDTHCQKNNDKTFNHFRDSWWNGSWKSRLFSCFLYFGSSFGFCPWCAWCRCCCWNIGN
jgi:hypothetical protein